MPQYQAPFEGWCSFLRVYWVVMAELCSCILDASSLLNIIVITSIYLGEEVPHAQTETARSQTRSAQTPRGVEPAPAPGPPCALSRAQLLRPPRLGAGQVRDAAPGARRWRLDQPLGRGVRPVTSFLLSGRGGLRTVRPGRARAAQARTAGRAQAHPGGARRHCRGQSDRPFVEAGGIGAAAQAAARRLAAPTQHRAWAGAAKKIAVSATAESGPHVVDLERHYEALRNQALNPAGQTPLSGGLTVLLHEGVAAWVRAWSQPELTAPDPVILPTDHTQAGSSGHSDLMQVLVAMALGASREFLP